MKAPEQRPTALEVALDPGASPGTRQDATVAVFRALANPKRLTLLAALGDPKTVPQLRIECDEPDPGSHLRDLEVTGFVRKVPDTFPVQWCRVASARTQLAELTRHL